MEKVGVKIMPRSPLSQGQGYLECKQEADRRVQIGGYRGGMLRSRTEWSHARSQAGRFANMGNDGLDDAGPRASMWHVVTHALDDHQLGAGYGLRAIYPSLH